MKAKRKVPWRSPLRTGFPAGPDRNLPVQYRDQVRAHPTVIYAQAGEASRAVAREIADLIRAKAKHGKKCILGFATGSTPMRVYSELVRLHQQEGLSFAMSSASTRRVFPDAARLGPFLRQFHAPTSVDHVDILPRTFTSRRQPAGRADGGALPGYEEADPRRPAASTCRSWASAAPAISPSTSPGHRSTRSRASSRSTP